MRKSKIVLIYSGGEPTINHLRSRQHLIHSTLQNHYFSLALPLLLGEVQNRKVILQVSDKDKFPRREHIAPQPLLGNWRRNPNLYTEIRVHKLPEGRGCSPVVCPFRFCGEASAAGPPGIPGMASAETDLCRGQHWKQGTEAQGKR